jgi:peptide/nickel transport system permease protein
MTLTQVLTQDVDSAESLSAPVIASELELDVPLNDFTKRRNTWNPASLLHHPSLLVAGFIICVVIGWAIVPQWFTSADPLVGDTAARLQPPSAEYWFGTDHLGRSIFGRVIFGAAESLRAPTLAVAVGFVLGSLVGLIAGFIGGIVDDIIMRGMDILLAIPDLLLALVIVTALGFGSTKVAIAVGISGVAAFARLMRSSVLRVRSQAFVEVATGLGLPRWKVILRHVLPNSISPVVALAAVNFGGAVLAIAALSFLGFGNPPPSPEWGAMVSDGRNYLASAWWMTALPGLVIIAVVISANRLSRGLDRGRETRR